MWENDELENENHDRLHFDDNLSFGPSSSSGESWIGGRHALAFMEN
jgi:hypothetical protein